MTKRRRYPIFNRHRGETFLSMVKRVHKARRCAQGLREGAIEDGGEVTDLILDAIEAQQAGADPRGPQSPIE